MHELVVLSGKGGTGKTSLVGALAALGRNQVLCDADVDAADLHLLLEPTILERHDFYAGHRAVIKAERCLKCGDCLNWCRFQAISEDFRVNPLLCEGCGVCWSLCPAEAVDFPENLCGEWFFSETRLGPLVHACLGVAAENSGKLVALVRADIAHTDSTVLIQGESGTGKELVARALHNLSRRARGPFVAVNCGALPGTLLESELFGHTAGAFTDARRDRRGRFAMAEGGTLFLDEFGDVSPALQVRLLRVLEERAYMPLGSSKSVKADVRIITATHKDLARLVEEGAFRKDLYYRINVVKLTLPRLAERKEDIPLLAEHFIERFNKLQNKKILGLSYDSLAIFMRHDWPGNIRELENAIEHAFILCPQGLIQPDHLPDHLRQDSQPGALPEGLSLKEQEKRGLWEALERNHWRRLVTARELGIDKNTLRRKIKRFGLVPLDAGHPTKLVH